MKSSFRIAHRHEGAFINTYFARPDTMEGAELIASIAFGLVSHPDLWAEYQQFFRSAMHVAGIALRVRGYGFALHRDMRVGFSERNGYRRVYRIGRWALQFLTPRS